MPEHPLMPVAVASASGVGAVGSGPGGAALAGGLGLVADVHGCAGDPFHVEGEVTCLLAAVVHCPSMAVLVPVVHGGVLLAGVAHLSPCEAAAASPHILMMPSVVSLISP